MKKFTITQSCPATVIHIFEVVAKNQTEALNKVIDGECDCIDIETNIHDFDANFIIEDESQKGKVIEDIEKGFLVDFYDSSDTNRNTSVEISIRANTLEDAIEDAIKKANEFQKILYIEFYHRHLFLGSINFAVSKEFKQGRGYNDFVNNKYADGGDMEWIQV